MESKLYEKGIFENRRAGAVFNLWTSLFGTTLEPPKDWVLGMDGSHWNGFCNFKLMNSKGMKFGITKATDIGSASKKGFVDDKAIHNYTEMGKVGWLRGGYHWLDPRYGSPEYQADFYLENFYFKYPTELPPILDFEDNAVISWSDMLWKAQIWLERVEEKTQRLPIVYTSNGYISNFLQSKAGFLARYPLWIAHYIQRSYPSVPTIWNKAVMWQYSDKGDYPFYKWNTPVKYGKSWGSGSSYLDMNWFMGSYDELLKFCGGIMPPLPPDDDEEDSVLFRAKFIRWRLNTRSGAGTGYPIVGYLKQGDIVNVYEEKLGWFRIDPVEEIWCSGNSYYMQKL